MSGTRVTATDLDSDESQTVEIKDDYVIITDGVYYLAGTVRHANGTVVLTLKVDR